MFVCKHCFSDRVAWQPCDGCGAPAIDDCESCKASGFVCDYDDERVHCSILS